MGSCLKAIEAERQDLDNGKLKLSSSTKHHLLLRHINLLVISVDQSEQNPNALESLCRLSKARQVRFIRVKELYLLSSSTVLNPLWQLFLPSQYPNRWKPSRFTMGKHSRRQSKEKSQKKRVQQTFSPASIKLVSLSAWFCLKEYLQQYRNHRKLLKK